jgi:protein phosphatase
VLDAPPPAPPDPEALATAAVSRTPTPVPAPEIAVEPLLPRAPRRSRLRSLGAVLRFLLPVVVIIGLAIGAIAWYAQHTYYVGFKGDRVVVYQGVPGGILGWKPTVKTTTELRKSALSEDAKDQINNSGKGSLERAQQFVANLEASTTTSTTTTTEPTTTSTTATTTSATTGST